MKRHSAEDIQKVRDFRAAGKSLPEICLAMGFCRSLVYSWIKDMSVPDAMLARAKQTARENCAKYRRDTQHKWRARREKEYKRGWEEAGSLLQDCKMRDFVCLYVAEGYRRCKNVASVVNTDPAIISLCLPFFKAFSSKTVRFRLWGGIREKKRLCKFWAEHLGISEDDISFVRKKQVSERRAEFGLMSIGVGDTDFRQRLGGWMDWLKSQWARGAIG